MTPIPELKERIAMRQTPSQFPARCALLALSIAALAFAVVFMLIGPPRGQASATLRVATAQNATLHKRILVTSGGGRTLYSLSAETHGRFICTGACLADWLPLVLKGGAKPVGVRGLGSVKRPDGRRQVTYRGKPLYRFDDDRKKGDVNGEGFRDVGVWHAAAAPTR